MDKRTIQDIKLRAMSLAVEQSLPLEVCPFCNGGLSEERSFSISRRQTGLLYNCFRATCGKHGLVRDDSSCLAGTPKGKGFVPKVYTGEMKPLNRSQIRFFRDKFGLRIIELEQNEFKYSPPKGNFIFPIHTMQGYRVGVVDRNYINRKPKAISYWEKDCPKIHFPFQKPQFSELILVEDTISAIKVARYAPAAALLGCHLSYETACFLAKQGVERIIMALDPDAIAKALKAQKAYRALFPKGFEVRLLEKDPKDQTNKELLSWIKK